MRLKSDFFEVLLAATSEGLESFEMEWDRRVALGVVMAAAGYPMNPRKGDVIGGLPKDEDEAMVFHAGTLEKDGQIQTSGGRVLCVTALADSVRQAQQKAYQTASPIVFDGMQMRKDIGYRAIKN
jgi:phosphoribosylamine--glycine ligase